MKITSPSRLFVVPMEESVEETQVPWLVGTDGARRILCKTLFLGEIREADETVVGDFKIRARLDDHEVGVIVI